VEGLWRDVRLGLRALRAAPVVTIVATLSIALGIGANTTIVSLIDSLILRKLPVADPDRLVLSGSPLTFDVRATRRTFERSNDERR
jgi:hypothetical protein